MTHFRFRRPQSYLRNGRSKSRQILYAGSIYQVLLPNRRGQGHVTRFLKFYPLIISLELVKLDTSNFVC